jgi:hypothetical protein
MADSTGAVLVGGLVTLAGAALQAGITTLRENGAWRRQQATRWDNNRLQVYADFLVHLHKAAWAISRATMHFTDQARVVFPPEEMLHAFFAERDQARVSYEQIALTAGSKPVVSLAAKAYDGLNILRELQRSGVGVETPEWKDAHAEMGRARQGFREAVRSELGLAALPSP